MKNYLLKNWSLLMLVCFCSLKNAVAENISTILEDACFGKGIYAQQFKNSSRRASGEAEERTHVRDEGFSPDAQQRGNLKCDAYNLPQKLAQAYQTNNQMIHEKALIGAREGIELLTKNYIEQLKYFKHLSDEKLERELCRQNLDFITDKTLLQKHILNLYEYEAEKLHPYAIDMYVKKRLGENKCDEHQAIILIYKIMTIFNGMTKNPELARELYGLMPREVINEWYFDALENKKKLFPELREFHCKHVKIGEGGSEVVSVVYIFGELVEGKNSQPMLMRMVVEKGSFGLFVREAAQTTDAKLIQKMEEVLNKKIALILPGFLTQAYSV